MQLLDQENVQKGKKRYWILHGFIGLEIGIIMKLKWNGMAKLFGFEVIIYLI